MNILTLGLGLASLAAQGPAIQTNSALLGTESLPGAGVQAWVEHAGAVHQLRLQPIATRAPKTFRLETASGTRYLERQIGNQFRGTVEGDPGAEVAAFYAGDKLHVLVLPSNGEGWTLAPDRDEAGIYESMTMQEAEWLSPPHHCGTPEIASDNGSGLPGTQGQAASGGTTSALTGDPQLLQVALDSDYEFFLQHANAQDAAAYMEGVLMSCGLLYERDLNIRFEATEIVVRPDPNAAGYPYTTANACGSVCMIPWWSAYVGEPFQTVHQFSGKNHPNQGGAGAIDALCDSAPQWNMWGYHARLPLSSYGQHVWVTSHELGHNCGAHHTIEGIMKSSNGFNGSPLTPRFRFDPISIVQIQDLIANLDPGCLPGTVSASATPTVSSVLPGSVSPFAANQMTVLGTDMQNTVEVEINGRLLTFDQFEIISPTEVRFPTQITDWVSLGTQTVTVRGATAESSGTFTLVAPPTPEMTVDLVSILEQLYVTSSYEPGWTSVVVWSNTNATFPQGSLQLLQGASVIEVDTLGAAGLDSLGWSPASAGITPGSTIYMQNILFDPVTATRAASPVVEVLVNFF